ncbi:cytochrome P450, partial [Diaporthe sp. PMI_573]
LRASTGLDILWQATSRLRGHAFLEYIHELLDVPGRTVLFNFFGTRMIVTDSLENIKAIQLDQFTDFVKGQLPHDAFYNILGDSIFATDGLPWKRSKAQLGPHVSRIRPNDASIAENHVQNMLHTFRNAPEGVDIYDIFDRLQLDIVTHVFLGESANSLSAAGSPFRQALDTLLQINTQRMLFGRLGMLVPDWLLAPEAFRELNGYMDRLIDKTLSIPREHVKPKSRTEFNLMEDLAFQKCSRKYVKDQIIAILMAAKDPAAILIAWTVYELSRRPRLVQMLQDEIRRCIGLDAIPSLEDLRQLKLLKNVIKESQRLYHPLGVNVREAKKDITLPVGGGPDGTQPVPVTKGQHIVYSVAGLQRNEAIHGGSAHSWDPARWEHWTPKAGEFLPYSIGPRTCLGKVFGQFQIEYTLVRILQEFEYIEWCGSGVVGGGGTEQMRTKLELNTKMAQPAICSFRPRQWT